MGVRDAYTQWSETYDHDRNLTRDLDAEATRGTLGQRQFGAVVELGCGTGKNTAFLAGVAETVTALDFSEGMLARAKEKVTAGNVSFAAADLTQPWPCADGCADLIVCNLVLEHIENLDFIFAEAARILRAGGWFFLCELHPFRQYNGVQAFFRQGETTTLVPAFVHHISEFFGAAVRHGLTVAEFNEWWHEEDRNKPPRLVSFFYEKRE